MELPSKLSLIKEYLNKRRFETPITRGVDCIVSGKKMNILVLIINEKGSFIDKGFSKNDIVDIKTEKGIYQGIIKELYSNYCYVQIVGRKIEINLNEPVSIFNSTDTSFLFKNMYDAFVAIFEKNNYKKIKELLIKIYSSRKLGYPIELKSFKIYPPSKKLRHSFFIDKLDEKQKELVSASLNLLNNQKSLFYLGFGPPGCGKTETITEIALQCMKMKKRILITSFTNVAVDNVMDRLIKLCTQNTKIAKMLKINNISSIKEKIVRVDTKRNIKIPRVSEVSLPRRLLSKNKLERDDIINRAYVVGATLDMLGTPVFERIKNFDLMIVDECPMVELPKLLLGLIRSRKFLLVGDPYQLQPFLSPSDKKRYKKYAEVIEKEKPPFTILMELLLKNNNTYFHTQLKYHYRGPEEIIKFSNEEIYGKKKATEKLICKTSKNKTQKIDRLFEEYRKNKCECKFIQKIFDPNNKVVWIDTSKLKKNRSGYKKKNGSKSYCNVFHAALDLILLSHFLNAFFANDDAKQKGTDYRLRIGIITPFNYQADLIEKFIYENPEIDPFFKKHFSDLDPITSLFKLIEIFNLIDQLEIGTVNKYQGREKDIIIYDTTYSVPNRRSHPALEDENKLNVALTRAKSKLIIIGSYPNIENEVISKLYNEKYVVFNPSCWDTKDINYLMAPIEKNYIEYCNKLVDLKRRSMENINDISKRMKIIESQEIIINHIVEDIVKKYPNLTQDFSESYIRERIREKIKIIEEKYYNTFPEKFDTITEKKRFGFYLDSEIEEELKIEREINSRYGSEEKIRDIDVLKDVIDYLEEKKRGFNKESFLYKGLERKILKLKIKLNELEKKQQFEEPLRGLSIGEFARYLKAQKIPTADWKRYKEVWAQLNGEKIPDKKILFILQQMKQNHEKTLKGLQKEELALFLVNNDIPRAKWFEYSMVWAYLNREQTPSDKTLMNLLQKKLEKPLRGLSIGEFARYLIDHNIPKQRWWLYKIYMVSFKSKENTRR